MVALLAAITVLFVVPGASAQSEQSVIDFGRSTSGGLLFSTEGGGNFTLRVCTQVVHGKCVGDQLGGPASASGEFGHVRGFYILTGNATTTGTFTGCVGTTCSWTLAGPSLGFDFTSKPNGMGTNYLLSNLTLLSLTEKPEGKLFVVTITSLLTLTGGILAQYFPGEGLLNVQFKTDKSLAGRYSKFYVRRVAFSDFGRSLF